MMAFTKLRNSPYALMAVLTVGAMDAIDSQAHAVSADNASNVGGVANIVNGQVSAVGTMALSVMFLGGVFFVGAGLMKLKQAADSNGQQVKYGEGMWRLAVGAGLVAVPAATGILTTSLGLGGVDIQGGDAPF